MDQDDKRLLKWILSGVLFVISLPFLWGSFFTVDQGDRAVVLRMGAFKYIAEPGLHFKLPLLDSAIDMSVRTQKFRYEKIESYSRDIQAADLVISVNLSVDPSKVEQIYSNLGVNYADRVVTPTILNRTKVVFGQYSAAAVINERNKLVAELASGISQDLVKEGLTVESVQLENVDFSDAFEKSIEARMSAEVEVQRFQQNLQRQKVEADILRTQAQAQADAVELSAKAQATQIKLKGDAEAGAIRAKGEALRQNAELVQLIQAERWDGRLPATMLPGGAVPMINLGR